MGSKTLDGVWFISYSRDHLPPHVHGELGGTVVIVELLNNGSVRRSERRDSEHQATRNEARFGVLWLAAEHSADLRDSGRRHKELHLNDVTTDEGIDLALAEAREFENEPRIVEAIFRTEPELNLLMLKLSDGRRLVLPREDLPELKGATEEQIRDFRIGRHGRDIWWPQLDDGIYLPSLLEDYAARKAA